jgi:hypothetical protein
VLAGGPQIGFYGVGFGRVPLDGRDSGSFGGVLGRRRPLPARWSIGAAN